MEATFFNQKGEIVNDHKEAFCGFFNGDSIVETKAVIHEYKEDPMFNAVINGDNVSIYVNPNEKIFNVLTSSPLTGGQSLCTTMSITDDEFDKFIEFMKETMNIKI